METLVGRAKLKLASITDLAFEFFPIVSISGKQVGTVLLCVDFDFTKLKPQLNNNPSHFLKVFKNCQCSMAAPF